MREKYDIVICSGAAHFEALRGILPRLREHGTIHLASTGLSEEQCAAVAGQVDVLHRPEHDPDPYENFKLFCIRDINRVVTAPWFVKLDTDVDLAADWFDYVEECVSRHPDAVLMGPHAGSNRIEYDLTGPLVRRKLGGDVKIGNGLKLNGSFYIGNGAFFREIDPTMQALHDLIYAFRDGRRIRPSHLGDEDREADLGGEGLARMRGTCAARQGMASEDNLRSLAVHVAGAGDRILVCDPGERLRVADKARPPSRAKRVKKWLAGRLGVPWHSTKKAGRQPFARRTP